MKKKPQFSIYCARIAKDTWNKTVRKSYFHNLQIDHCHCKETEEDPTSVFTYFSHRMIQSYICCTTVKAHINICFQVQYQLGLGVTMAIYLRPLILNRHVYIRDITFNILKLKFSSCQKNHDSLNICQDSDGRTQDVVSFQIKDLVPFLNKNEYKKHAENE